MSVIIFMGEALPRTMTLQPNGHGNAFRSEAQRDGEAFLWSECGYWEWVQKMPTLPFSPAPDMKIDPLESLILQSLANPVSLTQL